MAIVGSGPIRRAGPHRALDGVVCGGREMKQDAGDRTAKIKLVIVAASCNFLEMYDFMVFGYYAPWIAKVFFPVSNEFASMMLTLATYGAGFLMRPVGAIVLGAYMDRRGRRAGLLLTLGLMAIGTLSIACMPSYQSIGVAAPLLVLLGRLMQGLSAGAGVGGVSVYLSEIATPGNRGFYVSWQSASQQVAVVMASLVGIVVAMALPAATVSAWGWRIPFIVGMPDHPGALRDAAVPRGNAGVSEPHASPRDVRGRQVADDALAHRRCSARCWRR